LVALRIVRSRRPGLKPNCFYCRRSKTVVEGKKRIVNICNLGHDTKDGEAALECEDFRDSRKDLPKES
jgi:hypothetical protein